MITMSWQRTGSTTDTLTGMPVPHKRVKDDLADDLDHHASIHWLQLGEVRVRWRGGYAYVTGHLDTDDASNDEPAIPLCRLGYLGLDDEWNSRSTTQPPTATPTPRYPTAPSPAPHKTPSTAPAKSTSPTFRSHHRNPRRTSAGQH
jgi:hypothetical protein